MADLAEFAFERLKEIGESARTSASDFRYFEERVKFFRSRGYAGGHYDQLYELYDQLQLAAPPVVQEEQKTAAVRQRLGALQTIVSDIASFFSSLFMPKPKIRLVAKPGATPQLVNETVRLGGEEYRYEARSDAYYRPVIGGVEVVRRNEQKFGELDFARIKDKPPVIRYLDAFELEQTHNERMAARLLRERTGRRGTGTAVRTDRLAI